MEFALVDVFTSFLTQYSKEYRISETGSILFVLR
jgi:hypothetical protein